MPKALGLKDLDIYKLGDTIQLAGAVYTGEGKAYLCLMPGESYDVDVVPLVMDRDDWTRFLRQADLLETEVLTKTPDGQIAKAILRKSQRQVDQEVSWRVYRRDNFACRYCGRNDCALTIDHLVTWEEGGPTTEANAVAACRHCNKTRGNMSYDDWLVSKAYQNASKKLTAQQQQRNRDVAATLSTIPRLIHKKSR